MPVAHEQQLRDLFQREGQADDAVAPVVGGERQLRHHARRNRQPVRRRVHLLFGQIQLARSDVFVGVELDLLEADDARHDVHFAVRRGRLLRERIDRRHLGVGDRGRVVVARDLAHVRLAPLEIEPLDLVERPLDDVDRLRVQRAGPAREIGLADDPRIARRVDDDEVVRGDRAEADRVRQCDSLVQVHGAVSLER